MVFGFVFFLVYMVIVGKVLFFKLELLCDLNFVMGMLFIFVVGVVLYVMCVLLLLML